MSVIEQSKAAKALEARLSKTESPRQRGIFEYDIETIVLDDETLVSIGWDPMDFRELDVEELPDPYVEHFAGEDA